MAQSNNMPILALQGKTAYQYAFVHPKVLEVLTYWPQASKIPWKPSNLLPSINGHIIRNPGELWQLNFAAVPDVYASVLAAILLWACTCTMVYPMWQL